MDSAFMVLVALLGAGRLPPEAALLLCLMVLPKFLGLCASMPWPGIDGAGTCAAERSFSTLPHCSGQWGSFCSLVHCHIAVGSGGPLCTVWPWYPPAPRLTPPPHPWLSPGLLARPSLSTSLLVTLTPSVHAYLSLSLSPSERHG